MNIAKRTQISSQDNDQALSIEPQSRVQSYTVPAEWYLLHIFCPRHRNSEYHMKIFAQSSHYERDVHTLSMGPEMIM